MRTGNSNSRLLNSKLTCWRNVGIRDTRGLAEVPDSHGVMVYGRNREEAVSKVKALALRAMADRLEHGETIPELHEVFAVPARLNGRQLKLGMS